ncbi:beta-N-acetylhexosaminidase [Ferdinandcohnia quinoae]|uniref:beta-N-acetylhexosaminidase n=1 Tax=Fredinandcohnia quinoae TaxID=2918902 RepID=A0AAW5E6F2_9BACI|nr:glycoside hydrolase family 20 zincin-like fold domain-containing protein [Fredinandcohnia sp. SECRCQ15]MCH1624354.1 family 20 glycosylhydrolase [Fredinandcohnia sp. SECRCQ15]
MRHLLKMLPLPQSVSYEDGYFSMNKQFSFQAEDDISGQIVQYARQLLESEAVATDEKADIVFMKKADLPKEAYGLEISTHTITVYYTELHGLFYAFVTLKQMIKQYKEKIPCMRINDFPEIEVRGVMLDISRNKVPTLDSLYQLIDMLSDLKINHFQLYIEGFSFAYPSFEELWKDETPITGEELRLLDAYCQERFIDFVPNQNCLGHMAPWLETKQFAHLREVENGLQFMGRPVAATTLNPLDDRSIELVSQMTQDLLPNFTSSNYNVNLDEPFELGTGKSKHIADEIGVGQVYVNYVKEIHKLVTENDKKMLMWADVVSKHPEIIDQIPNDITLLEWGYEESHPYSERGERLKQSGLDFYFCPGTSSWGSITGRTENMINNITNAVQSGKKYGAKGILVTDWGDGGHWQCSSISHAGFSYGAALTWNADSKENIDLEAYLNLFIYEDEHQVMGDFSLKLGNYYLLEGFKLMNMTLTNLTLILGPMPKERYTMILNNLAEYLAPFMDLDAKKLLQQRISNRNDYQYDKIISYVNELKSRLETNGMKRLDAKLVKEEFENAIRLVEVGANLTQLIYLEEEMNPLEKQELATKMTEDLSIIIDEHQRLWILRNKQGGLEKSVAPLQKLQEQLFTYLKAV